MLSDGAALNYAETLYLKMAEEASDPELCVDFLTDADAFWLLGLQVHDGEGLSQAEEDLLAFAHALAETNELGW